jgi:hypothetical protein
MNQNYTLRFVLWRKVEFFLRPKLGNEEVQIKLELYTWFKLEFWCLSMVQSVTA